MLISVCETVKLSKVLIKTIGCGILFITLNIDTAKNSLYKVSAVYVLYTALTVHT